MKPYKIVFTMIMTGVLTGCQCIANFMGTGIGVDAQSLCGNGIGRIVNDDYYVSNGAFVRATRNAVGDSVYWQNGRTGNWGSYCPIRDGHTRLYGDYCREMMATVHAKNGNVQRIYSTACRRPDGTWYVI